jgi:hypothetical protein
MNKVVEKIRHRIQQKHLSDKLFLLSWLLFLAALIFVEGKYFFDANLNIVFILLICFSVWQWLQVPPGPFDFQYHGDPYDFLQINKGKLVLGKQAFPIESIQTISLRNSIQIGEHEYGLFSLPQNEVNNKTLSFYFDRGFYLSMHNYLKKHLPNTEFVQ